MSPTLRRRLLIALAALLALAAAALVGLRLAAQRLEAVLQDTLGPRASIGSVSFGWYGLELRELRLRAAPGGWPARWGGQLSG